jgi:hypothetical protein
MRILGWQRGYTGGIILTLKEQFEKSKYYSTAETAHIHNVLLEHVKREESHARVCIS